jgi:hypothetical protein
MMVDSDNVGGYTLDRVYDSLRETGSFLPRVLLSYEDWVAI